MIDEPPPHDRHRLEAAVRVLGKARHHIAVVHAPTVFALEVAADVAAGERGGGTERVIPRGVRVVVMHAEEKRVEGLPGEAEFHLLQHCFFIHEASSLLPSRPIRNCPFGICAC